MARATIQQVLTTVEGIQRDLEKLTVIIKGDPARSVVGLTTEIELLKQRNRFEDRLANIAVGVGSALLVFLLTNGCSQIMDTSTPAGLPATEIAPSPTWMVVVTPEPTPTSTVTVTPSLTPSPSIFEVTPLGGQWWKNTPSPPKPESIRGTFTPYVPMKVRWGAGIHFPLRYCCLEVGKAVRVYAWVSDLPVEAWLCMDEPVDGEVLCLKTVALVYEGIERGLLEVEDGLR